MENLTKRTETSPLLTTHYYYKNNLLFKQENISGGTKVTLYFEYDNRGNMVKEYCEGGNNITHTYNSQDQLIQTAYSRSGDKHTYKYDSYGNLIERCIGGARGTTTYEWHNGECVKISISHGGSVITDKAEIKTTLERALLSQNFSKPNQHCS
jgi:YD repeat-containing protein